jgi:hypothetical protein
MLSRYAKLEKWCSDLMSWFAESIIPRNTKSAMMRCFCAYLADSLESYIILDRLGHLSQACAVARCHVEATISGAYLLHVTDEEIDRYSEFATYSQARTVLYYKSTLGADMVSPPGWIEDLKQAEAKGRDAPYRFTATTKSGIRLDIPGQARYLDTHCLTRTPANWWSQVYHLSVKSLHNFAHPSALAVLYLKGSEDLMALTRQGALGSIEISTRSFLDIIEKLYEEYRPTKDATTAGE